MSLTSTHLILSPRKGFSFLFPPDQFLRVSAHIPFPTQTSHENQLSCLWSSSPSLGIPCWRRRQWHPTQWLFAGKSTWIWWASGSCSPWAESYTSGKLTALFNFDYSIEKDMAIPETWAGASRLHIYEVTEPGPWLLDLAAAGVEIHPFMHIIFSRKEFMGISLKQRRKTLRNSAEQRW